jgi:two-component system response regulator
VCLRQAEFHFRAATAQFRPEELSILDFKPPKISGLDLLRRIRAHDQTRLVPEMVPTSSGHVIDIATSCGLGANSCVRKSIDFDAFMENLHQLSVHSLLVTKPPKPAA